LDHGGHVVDAAGDHARAHAAVFGLGNALGARVLVARRGQLGACRQVHPQLQAEHAPALLAQHIGRVLLVHDTRARGHPLHTARLEHTAVAERVAVLDRAVEQHGHGLEPTVRVRREPAALPLRDPEVEVIEQDERIDLLEIGGWHGAAHGEHLAHQIGPRRHHGEHPCVIS
jgi:hypothetical protein